MTDVSPLRFYEPARLDGARLEELVEEFGEPGAERLIGRTLEDLAVRLNRIERCYYAGDLVRLCHGARELSTVASHIGLRDLARVALDVCHVAIQDDPPAIGATVSRLIRIGENSLMSVWDIQDLTV